MDEDDDHRWMTLVLGGFRTLGWLILAGTILGSIALLTPIVQTLAGRDTTIDIGMTVKISVVLTVSSNVVTAATLIHNRRLRRRIAELEAERHRSRSRKKGGRPSQAARKK